MYRPLSQKRKVIKLHSDIAIEAILFALEDHICIQKGRPCRKRSKDKKTEQSNKRDTITSAKDINIFDSILLTK